MKQRTGYLNIHDTNIGVWEEDVRENEMLVVLAKLVRALQTRGWNVSINTGVSPCLQRFARVAKKRQLELSLYLSGRHLEISFFQNVCAKNPHGGKYDFDKLKGMNAVSPALRAQCLVEMHAVVTSLISWGYHLSTQNGFGRTRLEPSLRTIRDLAEKRAGSPLAQFNNGWGSDRFKRDALGWPAPSELQNTGWRLVDRDGAPITQGCTKFNRLRDGRLACGQVFGGINGMWRLVSNGEIIANTQGHELFDLRRPDLQPRRVKDQVARLKQELASAIKREDFARAATLAGVLNRVTKAPARTARAA